MKTPQANSRIELQNVSPERVPATPKRVASAASKKSPPMFYIGNEGHIERAPESKWRRILKCLYNREENKYCGRSCRSWISIICYSILYLIFLSAYTMLFLYLSLTIVKHTNNLNIPDKFDLLTYELNGVGLSATPKSEDASPLLWFASDNFHTHVSSIDRLLENYRRKGVNITNLGPCAVSPYGYNENPCIIFRINKQFMWAAKPLSPSSSNYMDAPDVIKEWAKNDAKYWIHCTGSNHYDKEHSGHSRYYPNPPGIDPKLYPIDMDSLAPLVALQLTNFTAGVSLAIECKLWYDQRTSLVEFQFYKIPTHSHYSSQ